MEKSEINKTINSNIAKNLKKICLERDISQAELIKELISHTEVGKDTIYYMFNGGKKQKKEHHSPTPVSYQVDSLFSICEYLGVSIDGLIGENKPLSTDTDLQAVCEYTRLSEEAVEALKSRKTERYHEFTDKQFSDIIADFVRGYSYYLFVYEIAVKAELENFGEIKKNLEERYKEFAINHKNPEWLAEEEEVFDEIRWSFSNYVNKRKVAFLDIQELSVEYARDYSHSENAEEMENELEDKITKYENMLYCEIEERLYKEGDLNGEHNEED